jgi:hypothetical protein
MWVTRGYRAESRQRVLREPEWVLGATVAFTGRGLLLVVSICPAFYLVARLDDGRGVSSSSGLHQRYEQQHEHTNLQRGGPRYGASQLERPSSGLRRWSHGSVALVTLQAMVRRHREDLTNVYITSAAETAELSPPCQDSETRPHQTSNHARARGLNAL